MTLGLERKTNPFDPVHESIKKAVIKDKNLSFSPEEMKKFSNTDLLTALELSEKAEYPEKTMRQLLKLEE